MLGAIQSLTLDMFTECILTWDTLSRDFPENLVSLWANVRSTDVGDQMRGVVKKEHRSDGIVAELS